MQYTRAIGNKSRNSCFEAFGETSLQYTYYMHRQCSLAGQLTLYFYTQSGKYYTCIIDLWYINIVARVYLRIKMRARWLRARLWIAMQILANNIVYNQVPSFLPNSLSLTHCTPCCPLVYKQQCQEISRVNCVIRVRVLQV